MCFNHAMSELPFRYERYVDPTQDTPPQAAYTTMASLLRVLYEKRRLSECYIGISAATRASDRHPEDNQDALLCEPSLGLFGVFDGLGGHSGGGWASSYAANRASELIKVARATNDVLTDSDIRTVITAINTELYDAGQGRSKLTTAVVLLEKSLQPSEGREVIIAKSGDSRAYLLRDGQLYPLTIDHDDGGTYKHPLVQDSQVNQQDLSTQVALAEADTTDELIDTEPELCLPRLFSARNIVSSCLGGQKEVKTSITTLSVQKGDVVVLTTDGIHDNLKDSQIKEILMQQGTEGAESKAQALVESAHEISRLDYGDDTERAKPDDMTAVAIMF